ncbi:3,4-dihydroxyphenylacetate 2,3-dioxygenase [Limobrevibacterium gyesilva]|uniref:3,4-dihydroxyphenylacetate 2,3-dioxygenase n=1 Tax=Limobrevibacterium gyesilva TaxID=2991712 RepID=A0AA41YN57_9PROT|nr:3,4-dihydroxyphenylacetate 2,3-dioxygenase [Limobrevibacterium gyesilva]MCW3476961.1 3,4-dihydroxyphenylacetate 2,3-dioxygenase [Limobrevibacterium gyesilva]
MPIQPVVKYPPFNVVRASHVEYAVTDLARSRAYWVDALGFIATEQTGDALYLRGLEECNHHSVVLRQGDVPVVNRLGFKVFDEDDLDRAAHWFAQQGLPAAWAEVPHQGRTLQATDPLGMPLEFYHAMDQTERLLQHYGAYCGTHPQRIDHINCFTPDVQASHDFYASLGFRTSEYTATEGTEQLWAVWMHRKGSTHDLAFTNGRGPRLHHIGIWVASITNIIHVCDVLSTTGWLPSLERGPGRHGISNAFFLYLRDPDGHRIELFNSDYLTVDPDFKPIRWDLKDPRRQTLWGAPAPKTWFEEGSVFAGQAVRAPLLEAQPIVAP